MFMTNQSAKEEFQQKRMEEFSMGMSLSVIRFSVLFELEAQKHTNKVGKYASNRCHQPGLQWERCRKRFFSCFYRFVFQIMVQHDRLTLSVASGDLRHALRTFNGLPSSYSGHLHILLNDFNPFIFCRNIVLLLILGNVSDETIAADMALHFWYSAFIPVEYRLQLSAILLPFLQSFLQQDQPTTILGSRSKLSTTFSKDVAMIFSHFISCSLSVGDIQDEYNRVRTAPSRRDYRDRMYLTLKPAHRVAFQEYRRFGIVLPFGAMNAHFNCPNLSLFSPDGKWLQTDYADPLEGWESVLVSLN